MNLFAEPVLGVLGPLQGLLLDDQVSAVLVNGPGETYVEAGHARVRHPEPLDEAGLRALCLAIRQAAGAPGKGPLSCALEGGGHLLLVEAPQARGGPMLTVDKGRQVTTSLDQVAEGEVAEVLGAMLHARVSTLVVSSDRGARLAVLGALLSGLDAQQRVVMVEDQTRVRVDHAHVVSLVEDEPGGRLRLFAAAESLRGDWLGLPEAQAGGARTLEAAMRAGACLASCPGGDAEMALALLGAPDDACWRLAAGAFRAVLEVDAEAGKPVARSLREVTRSPDGRAPLVTLWVRGAGEDMGGWREAPSFAHRLALSGPLPWRDVLSGAPRMSVGSLFTEPGLGSGPPLKPTVVLEPAHVESEPPAPPPDGLVPPSEPTRMEALEPIVTGEFKALDEPSTVTPPPAPVVEPAPAASLVTRHTPDPAAAAASPEEETAAAPLGLAPRTDQEKTRAAKPDALPGAPATARVAEFTSPMLVEPPPSHAAPRPPPPPPEPTGDDVAPLTGPPPPEEAATYQPEVTAELAEPVPLVLRAAATREGEPEEAGAPRADGRPLPPPREPLPAREAVVMRPGIVRRPAPVGPAQPNAFAEVLKRVSDGPARRADTVDRLARPGVAKPLLRPGAKPPPALASKPQPPPVPPDEVGVESGVFSSPGRKGPKG
jgi:hypothetical protein